MIFDIDIYLDNAQKRFSAFARNILCKNTGLLLESEVFTFRKIENDFTTIVVIFISDTWLEIFEEQFEPSKYSVINDITKVWHQETEDFIKNLQRDLQKFQQEFSGKEVREGVIHGTNPRLFNLGIANRQIYASDYNFFVVGNADNGTSIFIQLTDE